VNFSTEPLAGTFRTTGFAGGFGLNQFNGLILEAGDWTLYIQDTVGSDALDFHSAELRVTTASVPDGGSTLVLLGLTLSSFAGLRRKFRM
jgi:subtilisin-like proprotein convertase family protein